MEVARELNESVSDCVLSLKGYKIIVIEEVDQPGAQRSLRMDISSEINEPHLPANMRDKIHRSVCYFQ